MEEHFMLEVLNQPRQHEKTLFQKKENQCFSTLQTQGWRAANNYLAHL